MPPISPRTQSFMQVPTELDAEEAFNQGFSDTASRVFLSKFPSLAQMIATFKVVDSTPDKGSAVGAFLLNADGGTLVVPVIMASNQLKPLEILYHQESDTYVPLSQEWVDEILKNGVSTLGKSTEIPKTLNRDVDIRNLIVPPYVGRFAYAAEKIPKCGQGKALAHYLTHAPNRVKKAFVQVLQNDKKILKYAFETFNKEMLLQALTPHPEKVAAAQPAPIQWLTADDPAEKFHAAFGAQAKYAYEVAVKLGYVAQDKRSDQSLLVEDGILRLSEITSSGFYRFARTDGRPVHALVIASPVNLERTGLVDKHMGQQKLPDPYRHDHPYRTIDLTDRDGAAPGPNDRNNGFIVITEDGELYNYGCDRRPPIGAPLHREEVKGKLKDILSGKGDPITNGSTGVFVMVGPNGFTATDIVEPTTVTTGEDGVRRIKGYMDFRLVTMVTDAKSPIRKIVARPDERLVYIPADMIFVKGERKCSHDGNLVTTPTATMMLRESLKKTGALKVTVKDMGAGEFSLLSDRFDGQQNLVSRERFSTEKRAVQKLLDLGLTFGDGVSAVKTAAQKGVYSFYVVSPEQLEKFAQAPGVDPSMMAPAQAPAPAAPSASADPNAAAAPVDPNTGMPVGAAPMAPPAPPPPSPVDIAVADIGAAYAQEAANVAQQLAQQQQVLADRLSVLQEVQNRAVTVATSMQTGQPLPPVEVAPSAAVEPPMDPAAEEAAAAEMAQASTAPMGTAADAAGQLEDPELFEASALANMAANPDLREMSADYIPAMEDTLDHIARMQLAMWMNEDQYVESMGSEDYAALEERLRSVFDNLGDLILRISRGVPEQNATTA